MLQRRTSLHGVKMLYQIVSSKFVRILCYLLLMSSSLSVFGTSRELFTAVSHLKDLVDVEKTLTNYLKHFINEEQSRIDRIMTYYNRSSHLLGIDISNDSLRSKYVGNPINGFLVLQRVFQLGSDVETLLHVDLTKELVKKLQKYRQLFPSEDDVKGAQTALLRLQSTYNLPAATMSDGITPNISLVSKMTAEDAYAIGKETYANDDFVQTAGWMREALRLMDEGRVIGIGPDRFGVLDHLAWAEYSNGNYEAAITYTTELLQIDPSNMRLQRNMDLYQRYYRDKIIDLRFKAKYEKKTKKRKRRQTREKFQKFYYTKNEDDFKRYLMEKVLAKRLCRGETAPVPRKHQNDLKCWHKASNPRLVLKPGRVEKVYVNPDVFLFRKVLSDQDIQVIKDIASPLLRRATVHNPKTGAIEYASYRISKSAWIDSGHNPLLGELDKRIESLTGLSLETAETLQVANYGIGGHYETHFDFSRTTPLRPPPFQRNTSELTYRVNQTQKTDSIRVNGDRIATFLVYMSDVEMGGGTVFTNIRQQIRPSKGDALFWYNLNDDGTGDYNTRHAACPVLIGDKWVANKWIHERGQEFRRRCPLIRYPHDDV